MYGGRCAIMRRLHRPLSPSAMPFPCRSEPIADATGTSFEKEVPVSDSKVVKLVDESSNRSSELPLLSGTLGPSCIDLGTLYKDTGHFTYDPGFGSTASTKSAITYIDGDK